MLWGGGGEVLGQSPQVRSLRSIAYGMERVVCLGLDRATDQPIRYFLSTWCSMSTDIFWGTLEA